MDNLLSLHSDGSGVRGRRGGGGGTEGGGGAERKRE